MMLDVLTAAALVKVFIAKAKRSKNILVTLAAGRFCSKVCRKKRVKAALHSLSRDSLNGYTAHNNGLNQKITGRRAPSTVGETKARQKLINLEKMYFLNT